MQVTIEIPDELAQRMIPAGQEPARAVFEDALVESYREHKISGDELMTALGIATRNELDGFLKAREVWIEYGPEEMDREREAMERILAGQTKKRA